MSDSLQESRTLAFLGFGELGEQIRNLFILNQNDLVVFDDNLTPDYKYAFPFNLHVDHIQDFRWVIALGYKHLEKKIGIIELFIRRNAIFENLIHESCFVSHSAKIQGVVAYPLCNIDKGVVLRPGVLLNNSVIVSHDSIIDTATYVSPGVVVSGNVKIGKGCFLGSGTIISNGVQIGDNVIVGAGTMINKDVPPNSQVIGNPMRILPKKLTLK